MTRQKILLHSRPVLSIPLREMVSMSIREGRPIDWAVLAYSDADSSVAEYAELLGQGHVHSLQRELPAALPDYQDASDLSDMTEYIGSIYAAVCTSKDEWGLDSLEKKPRAYQLSLVRATYAIYKRVLLAESPDFVLIPSAEQYDARILIDLCHELAIKPMIYAHARTLDRAYFTESVTEPLPSRAFRADPPDEVRSKARQFVDDFRTAHRPAFDVGELDEALEIDVPGLRRNLPQRVLRWGAKRARRVFRPDDSRHEPHLVDSYTIAKTLTIHYNRQLRRFRRLRGLARKRLFDLRTDHDLPKDFIYFPLQVTPEASIDAVAPFFRDQLRAIDLVLLNLPANWLVVVKEHPAMAGLRSPKFYAALKRRANLLLADYDLSSRALIDRARVTVSVTGTSTLEALLLGKASLQLGQSFFSPWVPTLEVFYDLRSALLRAAQEPPSDDQAVDLVARVFMIGRAFLLYPPTDHYLGPSAVMNTANIARLLDAVVEHVSAEAACDP